MMGTTPSPVAAREQIVQSWHCKRGLKQCRPSSGRADRARVSWACSLAFSHVCHTLHSERSRTRCNGGRRGDGHESLRLCAE